MPTKTTEIISPSDYHQTSDSDVLAVNPELKERLHCNFVTALQKEAENEGWILRMVPEETPDSGFPEVCLIPPGQEKSHVLHSFRIDAGIPDTIHGDDIKRPDVDRLIRIAALNQRAFAGPLDVHLPGILTSEPIGTFTSHGEGSYDPEHWASLSMKLLKELWQKSEDLKLFEIKAP